MARTHAGGWMSWLKAYGLFAGGVIGAGVFALPAALHRAGLPVFLGHVALVGFLVWWIHRCYLSVVLRTSGRHRLPGYARRHLGRIGFGVSAVASLLGLFGALVAYLLLGGSFLRLLLEQFIAVPPLIAVGAYLLPGALLLLWGIRSLPALELVILALFLAVLGMLPTIAGEAFSFARIPVSGGPASAFLPYGVLLFAFWGVSLVPETAELSRRSERRARSVLSAGLVTALLTYVLFAMLIAGITGPATTEDALTGLRAVLGDGVVTFTLLFGLLTTFSSYLALGLTLLRTLMLDFSLPRFPTWVLTVCVPFILVLLGVRSLLSVLAITGAVFLGIEGLAVLAMSWKLERKGRSLRTALVLLGGSLLLIGGVVSELLRSMVF